MPNPELLRIVDGIARDKNIEREQVYTDVEQAIASALRKQFNTEDTSEFTVTLERGTGDINVARGGEVIPLSALGRIDLFHNEGEPVYACAAEADRSTMDCIFAGA